MEKEIQELQKEIEQIKARNKRVEADKAWELSKTRTAFVGGVTFLLLLLFMFLIRVEHPFLNAAVSVLAYWISTQSYGMLKKWWLAKKK